jgi:sulfite exporter TauE/SafE
MFGIFSGFLTGFSTGIFCFGTCLPVFLPVLLAQKRKVKSSLILVLEFSLGRFIGYMIFGLLVGLLGQIIISSSVHLLVALANIWTGILMIFFSLGMIDKKFCTFIPIKKIKWPFLLGILTGVNICPPFLAAITHVFNLKNLISSLWFFFLFFLGTSVYIIPASILGFFTKYNFVHNLARYSGILVGSYFIISSVIRFLSIL